MNLDLGALLRKFFNGKSKRLKMTLITLIVVGANEIFKLGINEENIDKLLVIVGGYVGLQTVSDTSKYFGENREKVRMNGNGGDPHA